MIKTRVSAGMFWLYQSVFDAIGGFDESYVSAEDIFFAQTLKAYGKQKGLKYGTIRKEHIITSCRKFDMFGDWFILKKPRLVKEILTGANQKEANHYFYDVDR